MSAENPMSIWLDGKLVPKEQAVVSVFDHGLLYGDGVFEGIRIYSRRVFRLDGHLDRLYDSAKAIALDVGLDRAALVDALRETIKANGKEDGYIRLIVTRGVGDLGVDPTKCPKASVIIIVTDIQVYPGRALRARREGHHVGDTPGLARGVRRAREVAQLSEERPREDRREPRRRARRRSC
jgi:branched-subunit amino acid aminotransferase/4-amino-4-deoxychorismate lyase